MTGDYIGKPLLIHRKGRGQREKEKRNKEKRERKKENWGLSKREEKLVIIERFGWKRYLW